MRLFRVSVKASTTMLLPKGKSLRRVSVQVKQETGSFRSASAHRFSKFLNAAVYTRVHKGFDTQDFSTAISGQAMVQNVCSLQRVVLAMGKTAVVALRLVSRRQRAGLEAKVFRQHFLTSLFSPALPFPFPVIH